MTKVTTVGFGSGKVGVSSPRCGQRGSAGCAQEAAPGAGAGVFAELSPCLIGLEACASAHYWARELRALGHEVRLIPPQYVRPFVKTNKNDATDAEAICEALMRPTMRFAAVKSANSSRF